MSKKLNIQAVNASGEAAAYAITRANEVRNALIARLGNDYDLSFDLCVLMRELHSGVNEGFTAASVVPATFRDQLEPTANSYGFTLVDHVTQRDLVSIVPLRQA